jgi:purine-nucleoside phosphorylase
MVIRDHLNLSGRNPLQGPNDDRLGPRFPDMTWAYEPALRELAHKAAAAQSLNLKEGIYAGLLGPTYETPAEVQMLRTLGADAVGMSTVHEVIAANHVGLRVLGVSCISNLAAGVTDQPLTHDEVTETAAQVRSAFEGLLVQVVEDLTL